MLSNDEPQNLIIPVAVAQQLLNYILSQPTTLPVGEVYQLVMSLQKLQPLPVRDENEDA
jgi:hypothetical protein